MSKWTSKLRNIALSKLVRVRRVSCDAEDYIDAIAKTVPPSYFIRGNPRLAQAYQLAAVYHDLFMAAECDYYCDVIEGWNPGLEYLMGSFTFEVEDVTGLTHKYKVPLLICSSSEYTVQSRVKGEAKNTFHAKAGCRGLFGGGVMAVLADSDPNEVKSTLVHEMIHAMVASMPELRETMYGDNVASQTEEIVTHFVTDHFAQLKTLYEMDLRVKSTKAECNEKISKVQDRSVVAFNHVVEDILFNGQSIIGQTIEVKPEDSKLISSFVGQQIKEYNL